MHMYYYMMSHSHYIMSLIHSPLYVMNQSIYVVENHEVYLMSVDTFVLIH